MENLEIIPISHFYEVKKQPVLLRLKEGNPPSLKNQQKLNFPFP